MTNVFSSTDKTNETCTFGPDMGQNMSVRPLINASSYFPICTFILALIVLGKNIEGTRLPMVYAISILTVIQSAAVLILTSVFLCDDNYLKPNQGKDYNFWYALTLQLANLMVYVSLIWLFSWWQAYQNSKLKEDLQICVEQS
jgi:hypothetical protein